MVNWANTTLRNNIDPTVSDPKADSTNTLLQYPYWNFFPNLVATLPADGASRVWEKEGVCERACGRVFF
jgi:hypothetical protein